MELLLVSTHHHCTSSQSTTVRIVLKQFAGSRGAAVNLEGRSISTWSTPRHCIVTRLRDLTIDMYRNVRSKAGALIVELPESVSNLTQEEKQVEKVFSKLGFNLNQLVLSRMGVAISNLTPCLFFPTWYIIPILYIVY